ncbi:MAG: hypothetical protein ABI440_10360 [Casimicrobiaceae bacterium]
MKFRKSKLALALGSGTSLSIDYFKIRLSNAITNGIPSNEL